MPPLLAPPYFSRKTGKIAPAVALLALCSGTPWLSAQTVLTGDYRITGGLNVGGSVIWGWGWTNSSMTSSGDSMAGGLANEAGKISANGYGSIALGYAEDNGLLASSGYGSIALGYEGGPNATSGIQSTGYGSFAAGLNYGAGIKSSGWGSVAMGYSPDGGTPLISSGTASVALGQSVQATADNAFALGSNFTNSTPSTFKVGFGSTPTLSVSATQVNVTGGLTVSEGITASGSGITLADGTTLSGAQSLRSTALYNSSGQAVAQVGTDGTVTFTNGVKVGTAPITPASATYLNQTLANLGFRETPVTPTSLQRVALSDNITITRILKKGSFVYVVGTYSGQAMVGGAVLPGVGTATNSFVAKCSTSGTAVWARSLAASGGAVSLNDVAVNDAGDVAVAGSFSGTLSAGLNPASSGGTDGLVAKYDSNGQLAWAKAVGGTNSDALSAVCFGSGGLVAVGTIGGTISIPSPQGASSIAPAGLTDGLVVKLDLGGTVQWAMPIGGVYSDSLSGVGVDSGGGIAVAGSFIGSVSNLGTSFNFQAGLYAPGGLLVKLDSTGQVVWSRMVDAGTGSCAFNALVADGSGGWVVGGSLKGSANLGGSAAAVASVSSYAPDGLLFKVGSSGQGVWAKVRGSLAYDEIFSVTVDTSGKIWVGGVQMPYSTPLPPNSNPFLNNYDGMVARYSSDGVLETELFMGATSNETIKSLSVDGGQVWFAGSTASSTTWPLGDQRIGTGTFVVGTTSVFPVITPTPVASSSSLAWGASQAYGEGLALGSAAYAKGQGSAAVGRGSSTAVNGFAAGSGHAEGVGATALGTETWASGAASTAIGERTLASGAGAFAAGGASQATGLRSVAVGNGAIASGDSAVALGYMNEASGVHAAALGDGAKAQAMSSVALGRNNVVQGNSTTWVATDDLVVVGNGQSTPSNALAIHKNGDTRVAGTVQAKGGFRTPPMGDLSMGDFHTGANPADPSTGLNAGLRYPAE